MSNKQQGAENYLPKWVEELPYQKESYWFTDAEMVQFAEAYHTQKRAEELEGIVEDMERKLDAMCHDETTTLDWMCGFQEAQDIINHLKNKNP